MARLISGIKCSVLGLLAIKSVCVRKSYPGFTKIFVCQGENEDSVILNHFLGGGQAVSSFGEQYWRTNSDEYLCTALFYHMITLKTEIP